MWSKEAEVSIIEQQFQYNVGVILVNVFQRGFCIYTAIYF